VRFILTAHLRQARTVQLRIRETERLWDELERVIETYRLPDRTILPLYDAAMRYRIRNGTYRKILENSADDDITDQMASRDLKQMTSAGLIVPHGTARGRYYTATPMLLALRQKIIDERDPRDDSDPFA
jgi:hypothetical protein